MKGQALGAMAMAVLLLSGCASIYSTPPTVVHQPMTVRPEARTQMAPANGSIYQVRSCGRCSRTVARASSATR